MRPLLKETTRWPEDGAVRLVSDAGADVLLPDPDGIVARVLDLLDGTRTVAELCAALPGVDVEARLATLDAAGLLEDATAPTTLSARERERFAGNVEFFGAFATLETSRFTFQETLCDARVALVRTGPLRDALASGLEGLGIGRLVDGDPALSSVDLVVCGVDGRAAANAACVAAGVPLIVAGAGPRGSVYCSVDSREFGCLACPGAAGANDALAALARTGAGAYPLVAPAAALLAGLVGLEALRYLTDFAPPVSHCRLWTAAHTTGELRVAHDWSSGPGCAECGRDALEAPDDPALQALERAWLA